MVAAGGGEFRDPKIRTSHMSQSACISFDVRDKSKCFVSPQLGGREGGSPPL